MMLLILINVPHAEFKWLAEFTELAFCIAAADRRNCTMQETGTAVASSLRQRRVCGQRAGIVLLGLYFRNPIHCNQGASPTEHSKTK